MVRKISRSTTGVNMPDLKISVDSPAPDITLHGECDEAIALSDLWVDAERGIVLSFLRHYG